MLFTLLLFSMLLFTLLLFTLTSRHHSGVDTGGAGQTAD